MIFFFISCVYFKCGDLIYCFMYLTSSVNGQWPVDDITNTNTKIQIQIFSSVQGQGQVRKGHQNQYFQMSRLTHASWSILDNELDS